MPGDNFWCVGCFQSPDEVVDPDCFGGPRAGPAWWGGSVNWHSYSCLRAVGQQTELPCEGLSPNMISSDVPEAGEQPFHSQIIA